LTCFGQPLDEKAFLAFWIHLVTIPADVFYIDHLKTTPKMKKVFQRDEGNIFEDGSGKQISERDSSQFQDS
jgi:hypothetical protein